MQRKKVGIVSGGFTSEYNISILSGKTVFEELDRELWEVFLITINKSEWKAEDDQNNIYEVNKGDFTLQNNETLVKLDVIFNAVHGAPGENGQLAALWELLKIPFSSCDSYTAGLTYNKRDCLSVLRELKVPTAKYFSINEGTTINEDLILATVELPCFVKANRAGSSLGIYKVTTKKELIPSVEKAFEEDSQVIIESALEGREVSVGVAAFRGGIHVLPITEIITNNDFFDYAAKYEGKSQEITPAEIPNKWKELVEHWAKSIYISLDLKGVVRSEFIFVNGIPHLLEVNTVPGITRKSIIPKQVEAMGIKLSQFFSYLLLQTLAKN
jgi:D-alanine-D-alanine ligase|tara:strand:+ start:861 stop:1844 length:984 start_codon:yes stop_codon:yes gene_type:complete